MGQQQGGPRGQKGERNIRAGLVRRGHSTDEALVDEAIAHIRRVWNQGLLETVVIVGDYIIANFYGGDLEEARGRRAHKPVALARLIERAGELPLSAHALKECVRVSSQYHLLPATVADRLTKSQHVALLRIDDPEVKRRLAEEAVAEDLSVRALAVRSRKLQRPHAGGRPAEPLLLLRAGAALRALELPSLPSLISPAAVKQLNPAQVESLAATARALRDAGARIGAALDRKKGRRQ